MFCPYCGKKQTPSERAARKRGNGHGSVYRLPSGKYKAVVVVGYYVGEDDKKHRVTRSKVCEKKKDAVLALPALISGDRPNVETVTFKDLYDRWLPTHKAGKSTLDCYKAAVRYFQPVYAYKIADIDIDDLQECIDDCGKGKRTKENMRSTVSLMYRYGIPRRLVPEKMNLAKYLTVSGDPTKHRISFTAEQIELISSGVGSVPYADYVKCMIYLGFRPSEFRALRVEDYHREAGYSYIVGGAKTDAGKNRRVTLSPKIAQLVESLVDGRTTGYIFQSDTGGKLTEKSLSALFYDVLDALGIENPMVDVGEGIRRHLYTPHTCRHTFATLMKRVKAPAKDQQALIGHASEEMLIYYQDVSLDDLQKITNLI